MTEKSTLLIVDDTPDNLILLNDLLKDDYIVKAANSGEKAIRIAETQPQPDLILLDIMMPKMDGFVVCQKLKENEVTRSIPVIFISALAGSFDIVKAFMCGGVDYITKPFQPTEVKARVKTHIELYQAKQEIQTLLSLTLTGSIRVLIELLSLTQPGLVEQSARIRRYVRELLQSMKINPQEAWNIELATMLVPVGCLGIPQEVLCRRRAGKKMSFEELRRLEEHSNAGAEMLERIPRLEKVAMMIRNQNLPLRQLSRDENDIIYLGSAMLNMLLAFDELLTSGKEPVEAIKTLETQPYPISLIDGLRTIVSADNRQLESRIPFAMLQPEMILAEDLLGNDGNIVMGKGSEFSPSLIRLVQNFAVQGNCRNRTVLVWKPS